MRNIFNSIGKRITISFIIVVFLSMTSVFILSIYESEKLASNQMDIDGKTIVNAIKEDIDDNKLRSDVNISEELKQLKDKSEGNLVYVVITDTSGQIVNNSDDSIKEALTKNEKFNSLLKDEDIKGGVLKVSSGEEVYNVSAPLYESSNLIGKISVGISLKGSAEIIKKAFYNTLIISLIILIIASIIGGVLALSIVKPLKNMAKDLQMVAEGDFTVRFKVKTEDEIGKLKNSFNYVMDTLRSLVEGAKQSSFIVDNIAHNLSNGSEELANSMEEVANSSNEVASGAASQSNYITNIAESIEKLSNNLDTIQVSMENVSTGNDMIKKSADVGFVKLEELEASMNNIKKAFEESADKIAFLNENVSKITEITDVINAVATQTNLLALNAAIEAARAGESGRGFSVVAEEIRKLAEQVLQSSKSITELVNSIAINTQNVSTTTSLVSNKMNVQMKSVNGTVDIFRDILKNIEEISPKTQIVNKSINELVSEKDVILEKVEEISSISEEFSAATEEISSSTEHQASIMQEFAATAQELTATADKLVKGVEKFKC